LSLANSRASSIIQSKSIHHNGAEHSPYSFMKDADLQKPRFVVKQDSYKRLFGSSFNSRSQNSVTPDLKKLDSIKTNSSKSEEAFKKFIYSENNRDKEYFYSKFGDIYKTEEQKRFEKRYMKNPRYYAEDPNPHSKFRQQLRLKNNVFVGTKDFLVKTGISALNKKINTEKKQRMRIFNLKVNEISKNAINKFKIKRRNQKMLIDWKNKQKFITRGKSFKHRRANSEVPDD